MRRLNQERGFTIVEMMVAVVVLLVGALGTLAMLDTANKRSRGASDRQNGTAVARQVVEAAKSVPYRDVAPGSIVSTLRQDAAIAGISASPWRIERDNTVFTIQVEVCWLDEPADGLGSRAPGNFCCRLRCRRNGRRQLDRPQARHRRDVVGQRRRGGQREAGDAGLRARGNRRARRGRRSSWSALPAAPITDPMATSASFAVTTNEDAAAVVWSLDGAQQDTAAGSNKDWTFTWQLPPVDGAYDVSAQAFDSEGLGGEVRSATIFVNRFTPSALGNMEAARRITGVVEATLVGQSRA